MAATDVIVTGVGLVVGCVIFRNKLDPRRILNLPVKVNCWFCCEDARVPYQSKNAWTCPRRECLQYNGFTADGGYNREIVEQHVDPDETVGGRNTRYAQKVISNTSDFLNLSNVDKNRSGLCRTCTLNQNLKIHQLRTFEPRNEHEYDQEIQEFATHLERTYRLCRYCKLRQIT